MTKYWHPKKIEETRDSPGRAYSNRFLYENLSELLSKKEIKMLDIGCGSGYIREILYNLGYKLFYTGVDIKEHKDFKQFDKYALKSDFFKTKIENFNTVDKYDFVFSISALEHVEKDVLAVAKAKEFLKEDGVQVHIVPTSFSFFFYLFHGYRRYSKIRLKKLFGKELKLYTLGGLFSFFLHLFFITIPEAILNNSKPRESNIYSKLLNIANKFDCMLPVFSSLYVVVTKNENKTL